MLERVIKSISPQWALKREQARRFLAYYEAARPSTQRKQRKERNSASVAVRNAGDSIRAQARHLEQNHDLSRAVLRVLVNNTIGAHGIAVEPTPLLPDGAVHDDFARQLLELWEAWGEAPEVTRQHTWPGIQRILARTKYRDGEAFCRYITGSVRHRTDLPLSLELLEPDHFPIGYDSEHQGRRIRDAIELNGWGQPVGYWAYRGHPGEWDGSARSLLQLGRINAEDILHLAARDRLHQRRGMSLFASILQRLDDLKDYETSETIAAKVAASLGAAIKKGTPDLYPTDINSDGEDEPRDMRFRPGMIFDDLMPGESIEMIGSNGRPNAQMTAFRDGLLKAATSGVGVSSSTVSRTYDGSYSARRQELVDSWVDYAVLSQEIAAELVRPVYRRVINTALATGQLSLPRDLTPARAVQAMYQPPVMPWIDPYKESTSWALLEEKRHASGPEIIRKRGRSPADVLREERLWQQQLRDAGLQVATDPAAAASQDPTLMDDAA